MKNIEFRTTDKFGLTCIEKLNGRKFTSFVKKEAKERNVSESQVIRDFVENHFLEHYSDKEITSFEFTWLDEFNRCHKIIQYDIVISNKEIFTKVQREINSNCNKYKYNYYNYTNGKHLLNEWYDWISDFYDGLAVVEREDDNGDYLCNFIDKQGNILSEEWFKRVDYFKDGLAEVHRKGGLCNFINKDGKIISNEWFRYVSDFKDGFAVVERTNGEQAKIDKNGKIVSK